MSPRAAWGSVAPVDRHVTAGLVLATLAVASCGPDGERGTFVGSLRVGEDSVAIEARCRDGSPAAVALDGLVLGDDATVHLPFGDYASGGGHVQEVPGATVDDLRTSVYVDGFWWAVVVDDDRIVSISPWFVEGCRS